VTRRAARVQRSIAASALLLTLVACEGSDTSTAMQGSLTPGPIPAPTLAPVTDHASLKAVVLQLADSVEPVAAGDTAGERRRLLSCGLLDPLANQLLTRRSDWPTLHLRLSSVQQISAASALCPATGAKAARALRNLPYY
jgi:hypothetical protein